MRKCWLTNPFEFYDFDENGEVDDVYDIDFQYNKVKKYVESKRIN